MNTIRSGREEVELATADESTGSNISASTNSAATSLRPPWGAAYDAQRQRPAAG